MLKVRPQRMQAKTLRMRWAEFIVRCFWMKMGWTTRGGCGEVVGGWYYTGVQPVFAC